MNSALRYIFAAAILLCAATAFGSTFGLGVEVTAKQGSRTVLKVITDPAGRFATGPLEPGVYTFEIRSHKMAPPAHYFLALAGAKPISLPMIKPGVDLSMDAQVRAAAGVRGQVTARRLRIVAPTPPMPPNQLAPPSAAVTRQTAAVSGVATRGTMLKPAPSPAVAVPAASPAVPRTGPTATALARSAAAASGAPPTRAVLATRAAAPNAAQLPGDVIARSVPSARPTATPSRVIGRTASPAPAPVVTENRAGVARRAQTINRVAARNAASAAAARPDRPALSARSGAPRPTTTPAPRSAPAPSAYRTRMINGKPHVWVPLAPGSTLGRWVPETR